MTLSCRHEHAPGIMIVALSSRGAMRQVSLCRSRASAPCQHGSCRSQNTSTRMSTKANRSALALGRLASGAAWCGEASRLVVVVHVRLAAPHIIAPGNACKPRGPVGTGQHVGQQQRCARAKLQMRVTAWKRRRDPRDHESVLFVRPAVSVSVCLSV